MISNTVSDIDLQLLAETKVDDFNSSIVEHDIVRFQVSVYDTF